MTLMSAICQGCGQQYADEESGAYLFTSLERMERLLRADGWQAVPPLCPACQPDPLDETCDTQDCGSTTQVTWCPAWGVHLCDTCRTVRSDRETRVPLAAKQAMQAAAEVQP